MVTIKSRHICLLFGTFVMVSCLFVNNALAGCSSGVIATIEITTCNLSTSTLLIESTGAVTPVVAGQIPIGNGASNLTGAVGSVGITNANTLSTLTNNGIVSGGQGGPSGIEAGGNGGVGINNGITGAITTMSNNSQILGGVAGVAQVSGANGGWGGDAIDNNGHITNLINSTGGVIAGANGAGLAPTNYGNSGYGGYGVANTGTIGTLKNAGNITGGNGGSANLSNGGVNGFMAVINQNGGSITLIINSGIITGGNGGSTVNSGIAGPGGDAIFNGGMIGTLTNTGTLKGGLAGTGGTNSPANGVGIRNYIGLTTLNNLQGAGNTVGALVYAGALPSNYNIIINSPTSFGKLAVTSGTGTTNFGIFSGSTVRNGSYAAVLSGITSSNLNNTSGTFGSATWLLSNSSGSIWDLTISGFYTGPSVSNTNQSLINTASALQGTYALQNSVIANSFSYDCNVFGANNVCVSAGGRNTQVQAANGLNNTSALLVAAYRLHPNYRIGAFADQNLSMSNPGGTVNLGNNTPLFGLFGAWNERLDGTGTEVKVSAAYGQKNTTITRSVVGSGDGASEAGSGSSTLNSQGAQVTAKYGFGILDKVIVSPYVGVRYTSNTMGGYTEGTSSSVTAPLTYSALNTNATTALAGVGASYQVIPTITTFASAGVETDTNTANGTYSATNSSIGTLTPVNFNPNLVRTRPTATLGAYYDVAKNQRLGITGIYRQEAYQAVSTTTVLATYMVGL
jgi:Autotransporter beta-domain